MSSSSAKTKTPAIPRPSASLILVNRSFEVLLVQRNPKGTFASAHVFPGGNFDPKQDSSLRVTALRETFEEAGVLYATRSTSNTVCEDQLDMARKDVHSQRLNFNQFLHEAGLELDTQSLMPFTSWVTPPQVPKRFHTQFYLAFLPNTPSVGMNRLPTADGGLEVISASFRTPASVLTAHARGQVKLMPPQYYLLHTLACVLDPSTPGDFRSKIEDAQALARGAFGKQLLSPRGSGVLEDGRSILTLQGDEQRGGQQGRIHRIIARMPSKPGNTPENIEVAKNFDFFTEIEEHLHPKEGEMPTPKL